MKPTLHPTPAPGSSTYGFHCEVDYKDFPRAVARVTEALRTEGFGVLTEIDVQTTMKDKLDIDGDPTALLVPAIRRWPTAP